VPGKYRSVATAATCNIHAATAATCNIHAATAATCNIHAVGYPPELSISVYKYKHISGGGG
jgi:hypothetical protein